MLDSVIRLFVSVMSNNNRTSVVKTTTKMSNGVQVTIDHIFEVELIFKMLTLIYYDIGSKVNFNCESSEG